MLHPSDKHQQKISAILQKHNNNEKIYRLGKRVSKIAVIILICISISFSTLLTAQAVRESVATTILEWHDKFTRIFIKSDAQPQELPEIRFNYIPEGFELVEEESLQTNTLINYTFKNNSGNFIKIQIDVIHRYISNNIDNEYSNFYYLIINNTKGLWIQSNDENSLIIPVQKLNLTITSRFSIDEIIQIYKNIEIL